MFNDVYNIRVGKINQMVIANFHILLVYKLYSNIVSHKYIWANFYNISLPWIKAIWGWFPLLTMIPVRSQWGRYNLPRLKMLMMFNDVYNMGRLLMINDV